MSGIPSMGPATRNLNQVTTYWVPTTRNAYNEWTYAPPILTYARWAEDSRTVTNMRGDEITYNSLVLLRIDVVEEGYLALGDYVSGSNYAPNPNDGVTPAHQVKAFHTAADLRNMEKERRAYCG